MATKRLTQAQAKALAALRNAPDAYAVKCLVESMHPRTRKALRAKGLIAYTTRRQTSLRGWSRLKGTYVDWVYYTLHDVTVTA